MQHNRGRAESAPVAPNPRILFREAARPERRIPQAVPSAAGQGGNAINDGTRAVTTGEIDWRKTARRGPQFPPVRKHSTSDHIDTSVLDPDADDEAEEGEDEHDDEEEEEEEEDHEDETQRRTSSSGESGSGATLADRQSREHETIVEHPPEKRGQKATESQPQNIDPSQAEKGEAGGLRRRTRSRTGTQTSARSFKDPETRQWKDNIVTFDGPHDPANPKNWPYRRKVFITMLMGLTTMCSTFASSVFSPALPYVARQYGISEEVSILGLSLFIVGFVPGPIVFAPLSEIYGRKWPTLAPLFISACFAAATATAENLQTIMITRFFAGVFASAPVTNVGGGLADMWDQRQRATAVVFYSLAVVAGPNLGPIVGSAFSQSTGLGWRWTEYFTVILTCSVLVLDLFFFPETFAPAILNAKARKLRWKTGRWELHSKSEMNPVSLKIFLHKHLELPLKMIVMEPMVLCITMFNSFAYGVSYLLFAAIPIIFEQHRGWSSLSGSLPFLALLLGSFTAAGINVLYSEKVFSRKMLKYGVVDPEWRLPPMMLGSICFPIGFFILGWTSNPSIFWFPSVVGLYFVGISFLLIFQGGLNYLLDAYTASAASAVAANTFLRSAAAGALPLVARPMYNNLGVPWACTLLGCICLLFAGIPILFFKYGPKLRSMSRLARS